MTQQRISVLLFSFLLTAVGCGGGTGEPVDTPDPNAVPKTADQQPRISNQNPVSSSGQPPDPSAPVTPPPAGGGGSCVEVCNGLPALGCELPEDGCAAGCAELGACTAQALAFEVCALAIACPEDIADAAFEAVVARCPNEYQAYTACRANDGG